MRAKFLGVLASALLIGMVWAQDRGVITGTVLDEHGSPVVKAKVLITEKGVFVAHRVLQFHETDADGRFRIARVPWGTYIITVGKEDAGYADTGLGLHCNDAYPIVVLSEDSATADVTLNLGPKASFLDIEPLTDELTRKEIRSAAITLRCADNNDLLITTSTTVGRILVPALTNVVVNITAAGYKPWPAQDRGGATDGRIFLRPEQTHKLQVSLQPEDPQPPSGENKPN
jgi:Carboxypeptidase regulatory-like domain